MTTWTCLDCGSEYDDRAEADCCCDPELFDSVLCTECRKEHTTAEQAEECCAEKKAMKAGGHRFPCGYKYEGWMRYEP